MENKTRPILRALGKVRITDIIPDDVVVVEAAGLNPWCMNEGLAGEHSTINVGWAREYLDGVRDKAISQDEVIEELVTCITKLVDEAGQPFNLPLPQAYHDAVVRIGREEEWQPQ